MDAIYRTAPPHSKQANCRRNVGNDAAFALYCGDRMLAVVVPDEILPGMYRIRLARQKESDIANLSRAKDAAAVLAERAVPRPDPRLLRWENAHDSPVEARRRGLHGRRAL